MLQAVRKNGRIEDGEAALFQDASLSVEFIAVKVVIPGHWTCNENHRLTLRMFV